MANPGSAATFKGIDCRQSGDRLLFRASLKDAAGAKVTSGTTNLTIYEFQSDGTLKSYDFNDNTFKTTALTTPNLALTHRTGNNGTTNTGVWTNILSTLTGFTRGNIYLLQVNNTNASPPDQEREIQYGDDVGDLSVNASGQVYIGTIRKNVAFNNFEFPMVDTSNNIVTGISPACQVSIDGGAFTNCTNTPGTELGATGVYKINLSAADLNGTTILFRATGAGAVPTKILIVTTP